MIVTQFKFAFTLTYSRSGKKQCKKKNTQDTSIDGERTSTMPSLYLMGVHTKFGGLSNPREEKGPPRQSVQQP